MNFRGRYVYKSVCNPSIKETLPLTTDAGNEHDAYAIHSCMHLQASVYDRQRAPISKYTSL